jgi:hypothetical protein
MRALMSERDPGDRCNEYSICRYYFILYESRSVTGLFLISSFLEI